MEKIYSLETGECKTLDSVDAKEHIATGRWSSQPIVQPMLNEQGENFDEELMAAINDQEEKQEEKQEDTTTAEAYAARQAEFEQAEAEKATRVTEIEKEIKKAKSKLKVK